jgi:PEP-CTERM motif
MNTKTLLAAAALLALAPAAQAQISITSPGLVYTQSFDTLSNTGTTNAWVNDSTLPGWSLFSSAGVAVTNFRADAGTSNTGAIYSYGSTGSTERALGSVASGSFAGTLVLALANNSGSVIDSFTLGYTGEQWRNGGNTAAQSLTLEYGFGASYATTTFTAPGGFGFTSPVVGATAGAVDGNAAGTVANLGGVVGTNWAVGETLWLRWVDLNDTGNDHGLAIDNLSFSVTAVPEPGTVALWLAGLAAIGFVARRRG